MIRRILVPLDGSPLAEEALGHAAALAASFGAEVLLLQVVEAPSNLLDPVVSGIDWRLHRAEAAAYLEEAAEGLRAGGVEAGAAVVEGRAANEIVAFARNRAVDLVILSAYGLGDASDFTLGGTVHKVLSSVLVSVMVVRPLAPSADASARSTYRRILAPVNGGAVGEWALCQAAAIAAREGAEMVLLQVLPESIPGEPLLPRSAEEMELLERLRELRRRRAEQYLGRVASRLAHSGIRVRQRVVSAPQVAEGVLDAAREEGADLVVVGAHGTAGAACPYGAVSERLLARCPIPLLVLQDLAGEGSAAGAGRRVASGS